jgi:hypothetical protein
MPQVVRFYSQQQPPYSFGGTREILININGTSQFLDTQQSYLYVRVQNKCQRRGPNGTGVPTQAFIDGSAHSLINRLRVAGPDGTEIERIERYNRLASIMGDCQMTKDHATTQGAILAGFGQTQLRGGGLNDTIAMEPVFMEGEEKEFTFHVMSGLLSQKRYIPLGALKSSGIRLEMLLEDPNICMTQCIYPQTANNKVLDPENVPLSNDYEIKEVYFVARLVNFEDDITRLLIDEMTATQTPLALKGVTFEWNQTSNQANTGTATHVFSSRARSVKALISSPDVAPAVYDVYRFMKGEKPGQFGTAEPIIHVQTAAGPPALFRVLTNREMQLIFRTVTTRPSYDITQYQYRIGQYLMPTYPISLSQSCYGRIAQNFLLPNPFPGSSENANALYRLPAFAAEVYKAFNRFGDVLSGSREIHFDNFACTYGYFCPYVDDFAGLTGDIFGNRVNNAQDTRLPSKQLSSAAQSKFVIMMDTEAFIHDNSILESGMDTASNALTINLEVVVGGVAKQGNGVTDVGVFAADGKPFGELTGQSYPDSTTGADTAVTPYTIPAFGFSMNNWTMQDVFFVIDVNGMAYLAR